MQRLNHKVVVGFALSLGLVLTGCGSTSSSSNQQPILVGSVPNEVRAQVQEQSVESLRSSEYFLDVAVPVFNPGLPMKDNNIDYEKLDKEQIWPQLRRTEAKIFAVETKNSLEKTAAFSSVRVVPDANTSADVFVLGEILESDSQKVGMELLVVDSSGALLGMKRFEHRVNESFFSDQRNTNVNPYQPMFDAGRDYVIEVLSQLSDEQKKQIKDVSLVRYAAYYNPEAYSQYIQSSRVRQSGKEFYQFELTGIPSEDDANFKLIENLRAQELLFVDRLQDNYDSFYAETDQAYSSWQKETLPEIIAYRKAKKDRNIKAGLGAGLAVVAGVLASNSNNSDSSLSRGATRAAAVLAGAGSAYTINEAFKSNSELKVQSAIIEEKGQATDLSVSPIEMKFEGEIVELKGTANEQYLQWKQHLRERYEVEKTPDVTL